MKKIILLFSLTLLSTQIIFSQNNDFNKIKELMTTQSEAWNRGDIDGFMTTYWKSEKLQFIGSKGITYGWKNTLDRYKKSYPSKETMGFLTFDIINLDKRSRKVISVVGKWHLKRDADLGNLKGHFLLILKKIKGNWLIVADHSS
jgi:ketosteroid isomerase-like protein